MSQTQLDTFTAPAVKKSKPLIQSQAHAEYLYEQSYEREVEKNYNYLIARYLEDEKTEKFLEEIGVEV